METKAVCLVCGMGIDLSDPWFHLERYGHEPQWSEAKDQTLLMNSKKGAKTMQCTCGKASGHDGPCYDKEKVKEAIRKFKEARKKGVNAQQTKTK